jgi:hypothetical protein
VSIDDSGRATVSDAGGSDARGSDAAGSHAGDLPGLALPIDMLGALYLGGVSARTLVRAGRVTELSPGSADLIDASFRSPSAPWLSTWF